MSGYWIQILIFTVALLFFCWLLLEYWYYRKEKIRKADCIWRQKQHLHLSISGKQWTVQKKSRRIPSKIRRDIILRERNMQEAQPHRCWKTQEKSSVR